MLDDKYFTASVQVQTSRTFYAWVFTFGGEIEILEPEEVREAYLSRARKILGVD